MRVLVAYASKRGSTAEIAERIAATLRAAGQSAEARPIVEVDDLAGYDACVVGSALYVGAWLRVATEFLQRHQADLTARPVWLFSSGPLGGAPANETAPREDATPRRIAELHSSIGARGHRVFFGALDPARLGPIERLIRLLPAGRRLLAEGDFRDWPEIEGWAREIAADLAVSGPVAAV